ncbi:MAG: DNA (cytosine-5-)-methyltransferase [Bacteroidia bacterium]|nr:DNA (cytosine-5-)-methyltransferase [Bacteroidia bacterium]
MDSVGNSSCPLEISASILADILQISKRTAELWAEKGKYDPVAGKDGATHFPTCTLVSIPEIREMMGAGWEEEMGTLPVREYTSVELFSGAGGLALGLEKAGFTHVLLNEVDEMACRTLQLNRPRWPVKAGDVHGLDFKHLRGKVDLLAGGFPCQPFSYAGKQGGFGDTRGTLFFELARAVEEIQPRVLLAENVRGLAAHDAGRTLATIRNEIDKLGYTLVEPRVLQALLYRVPQKRERLILIAIRNDLAQRAQFHWPTPYHRVLTMRDALYAGELYPTNTPASPGVGYNARKAAVLAQVPMGGYWRDLPVAVQQEYLGTSYGRPGGKTGMARRLSLDEPSLTLVCAPAQKQTERCHPTETRPLTVREYARVQTFPDEWQFCGSLASQYKQVGNAVPVNLAWAVGRAIVRLLNGLE